MQSRVLGVDYGVRRIGVAVADLQVRIASPLATIAGRNDVTRDARAVADVGEAQSAGEYVVGLPVSMNDGESDQTRLTRRFAGELERLSGRPVHLHDERLTTDAAHDVMDEAAVPRQKRKELADRIAAQKILQSWLDQAAPDSPGS